METVLPFLAWREEPFKNVDFIYLFASLITSEVRVDRSNLAGEERVGCCGWYPGNVTGPVLQTTSHIGEEGGRRLRGGRRKEAAQFTLVPQRRHYRQDKGQTGRVLIP